MPPGESSMSDAIDNLHTLHAARPSVRRSVLGIALAIGLMLLTYHHTWRTWPAGDDYLVINETFTALDHGPMHVVTHPLSAKNYRPLQGVGHWAMAQVLGTSAHPDELARAQRWTIGIHALNLGSCALLIAIGGLWARELPGRAARVGVWITPGAIALHPVMAGQAAGLDMWTSIISPALMWAGAYCVYRWRARLAIGVGLALIIGLVAVGFKEYAFSLAPVGAVIVLLMGGDGRRGRGGALGRAVLVGAVLSMVIVASMLARQFVSPMDGPPGSKPATIELSNIPANVALYGASLSIPINTAWVFIHGLSQQRPIVLLIGGLSALLVLGLLVGGLWRLVRRDGTTMIASGSGGGREPARWIAMLVLAGMASTFPNVLTERVSEVYASGPLLALALLMALSVTGWLAGNADVRDGLRRAARVRRVVFVLAVLGVVWGVAAYFKAARIDRLGQTAFTQAEQILDAAKGVSPDASGVRRIAVVFVQSDLRGPAQALFSVYSMPDNVPLFYDTSMDWFARSQRIRTVRLEVPGELDVAPAVRAAGLSAGTPVLRWRADVRRFERLDGVTR
jgi:hypothetical protein